MKFPQRFATIFLSVILACVVGGRLLGLTAENAQDKSYPVPAPNLSYDIPVNPNTDFNSETNFGTFAWQTFVALNWPADCNGLPLKEKTIGEAPNAPRIWEFYQFPEDVFKPNEAKPNLQSIVPVQCPGFTNNQSVDHDLRFTEFASEPALQTNEPESDQNLRILIPGQKPLIDRAGNYILNEVRMNPVEVNQIVENGWYSAQNLDKFNNTDNPFTLMCSALEPEGIYPYPGFSQLPCSANKSEGTIELKAAWMVFPDHVPDELRSKYYTTTRTFDVKTPENVDGKTTKVTVPLGLVGFHIVQKTSQQGWIWATFEHIDNAPDDKSLPTSRNYNLYASDCQNCERNKPNAQEPYLWRTTFPHAVTKTANGEIAKQIPSQITRLVPIPPIAQSLNSKWREKLAEKVPNSIWQNYQLIGVQWLENPFIPYNLKERGVRPELKEREVKPNLLANVTLEPYIQKEDSCIACHTRAQLPMPGNVPADFSFLMNNSISPSSAGK